MFPLCDPFPRCRSSFPMNTTTAQPTQLHRIQQRLAESRVLSFSVLIHAILIALAGTYIITHQEPPEDMIIGQIDETLSNVAPLPEQEQEKPKEPEVAQSKPEVVAKETKPNSGENPLDPPRTKGRSDINIPLPPFGGGVDIPRTIPIPPSPLPPHKLPATIGLRFNKDTMGRILTAKPGKPGSTTASEDAVISGLRWLRTHQAEDGSWGDQNKSAMTGLALLCFLGHGELADSKEFGYAVNKGIQWLVDQGTIHQGRLSMTGADWGSGNAGVYEHAIATYALGEYFTMSKDERVLEVLRPAVNYIVQGQSPDGGWMYHFDKTQGDTSVSGWQVQALKAAHLTGLHLSGVDIALDRAMEQFARVRGPGGGYGYRGPEDRYSLTGVGVLCQLFWGEKRTADLRRSVNFISEKSARDFPVKYQHEKADLYAWYYHSQAMLMFGGVAWLDWNKKFQDEIVRAQVVDGSWPVMKAPGHGNLQSDPKANGATYRTALSILMLEVYYRYMPTQQSEVSSEPPKLALR